MKVVHSAMVNPASGNPNLPGEITDEWIENKFDERSRLVQHAPVIRIDGDSVWIDIGSKFESTIPLSDWDDDPRPQLGDKVSVMITDDCEVADRPLKVIRVHTHRDQALGWASLIESIAVGKAYPGHIVRRISGGFLVDVGVITFLPDECATPAMQDDEDAWIEKQIRVRVTYIDESRREIRVALE